MKTCVFITPYTKRENIVRTYAVATKERYVYERHFVYMLLCYMLLDNLKFLLNAKNFGSWNKVLCGCIEHIHSRSTVRVHNTPLAFIIFACIFLYTYYIHIKIDRETKTIV